ncbi:succinate dehydrogenase/fumarate reductase flavoprotein subunit, partial [Mycobacterium tuberculosis]|nr:succinate dehydrogenase/fumarate reductase flavoprotein subunit [Mycobacterium tuberculosis]
MSVHGANRLGSNSLLDLVVFGRAAAIQSAKLVSAGQPHKKISNASEEKCLSRLDKLRNAKGKTLTANLRLDMQKTMQKHCAVFR